MPGPVFSSPSSITHKSGKSATEGVEAVVKKSVIGRIKSKLSKNLGRRKSITTVASPTSQDLIDKELVPDQQQIQQEENNEASNKKEDVGPELHQSPNSETEVESPSVMDAVLQFDASLLTLESVFSELDRESTSSVEKNVIEEKDSETPEQIEDGIDVDDDDHKVEYIPGKYPQQTPDEDDEDTLEVFENGAGNQQRNASPRAPEDDDEDDNCLDNEAGASRSFEPLRPMQTVDLMIIGVTPISLRNYIPCDDLCDEKEEEPFVDAELDVVSTPRINEPVSSPLKRARPGVDMKSPRGIFSQGNNLPHPPLQEIREEDDNTSPGDQFPASLWRVKERRHPFLTSEAPILASASAQCSPQGEEEFEALLGTRNAVQEEPRVNERAEENDDADVLDTGALITRAFGERIVNLLAADPWGDRQDGFDAITLAVKKINVSTLDPATRQRLLCASLAAVQCGVEDRIAPVMFCALECFRAVLKEFARVLPDERMFGDTESNSAAVLNTQLSVLVAVLVKKLGDSNKRTQREATQALIRIARLRSLRALPHVLLHLSGREVPPRRQLETLRRLMRELGLTTSADASTQHQQLTVETVLQFVAPSLKIVEEKTRKAAVEILADLQTRTSHSTAWHDQLARAGAVKPEMLRVITRRVKEMLTKREQQQAADVSAAPVAGSTVTNQTEERVDDEAAFPPAELVDVPQEDAQSSINLLEASLSSAQTVVGPVCWRKLSSKTWSDRKEALLAVEKAMTEAKSDLRDTRPAFGSAAQSTFVAYCAVLHRALGDSIAPVVNTALDTFTTLIKIYGPRVEWRETDVREVILLTLLRLLAAMQKPNTRTTRAACRGVLKLARLPNARHPLRYVLSCVFGGEGSSVRDAQVQMHLLRLLVPEFGFQADGLGASRVLDAVSKGLTHSSARVRRSAADVALSAQRLLGRDFVLSRLQGVKPVTLKELEKSFVDGVGGSGGGERPQTVHATAEPLTSAASGDSELSPVTFGGLGEFSSRRLLSSAPVGIGRLQCTPLYEETSADPQARASVLSNEEENLMDSIVGGDDFLGE